MNDVLMITPQKFSGRLRSSVLDPRFRGTMNRIFSSVDSMFVAVYYAVVFLTPANVRGATRLIADCGLRIADFARSLREVTSHAALIFCGLMLASAPGLGQTEQSAPNPQSAIRNPQSAISAALPQDAVVLRREGNEALYNMDYATARAKFEEIKKRIPHHPAGDLYVATVIWIEHLNKSRRLQTSLYKNESSFYAGAEYFLGAYYGVMAGYEASTARKFFSAIRNGSRGVDAHEKTVKLDPNYYDAYLSLGMYDYIVGSLPFVYKALAALGGARGNKQRGIARLKGVIEKETTTADDARVMLLAIYQNEKRYE